MLSMDVRRLLDHINSPRMWDREPVFCFTVDVDWASEAVLGRFFSAMSALDLKLTVFVTHASEIIEGHAASGEIELGIHPNFLPGSSHGEGFRDVIEACLRFAPEAKCFRSHQIFDVTGMTHLLIEYGIQYDSNLVTLLQTHIRPILHGSGLVRFPVFFEDGTYLCHRLGLHLVPYQRHFTAPGLKIISLHPLDFVINTPDVSYSRRIKDSLSREEYASMSEAAIDGYRYRGRGIADLVREIIAMARAQRIMSLSELYALSLSA
jgi:hypothetical protein